jgi:hypothetical protein
MPDVPSEPEKYSIDEMMERLKNAPVGNPEDGELVRRADGTTAIRVRKRKRRSTQTPKSAKKAAPRGRVAQTVLGLTLFFLAALAIGVAIVYANSSPFRAGLTRNIERASGAKIKLSRFRMNPKTANAGELLLEWPDGNTLKSLTLSGLTAEISPVSFLGKKMSGEEVSALTGTLALQIPKADEATRHTQNQDEDSPIQFQRYRVPTLNLTLGDPAAPLLKLLKSEASLNPDAINGRSQLSLYQGEISMPNWPKLRLDRALIEFHGNETDIVGLRILHESAKKGSLELTGTVYPYDVTRQSVLAVDLDSFDISGLIGPALGGIVSGEIDSLPAAASNFISFFPIENSSPVLDVAFRRNSSSKLSLQGLPFFLALARTLDDSWFEKPGFDDDASGVIHREKDQISVRNINFVSKSRMALEGEISITGNQALSGNLELGISGAMLEASVNARLQAMFSREKNGFRWLTLKLGGSAAAPSDNFKELFLAATPQQKDPPAPDDARGSSFEELTRPK